MRETKQRISLVLVFVLMMNMIGAIPMNLGAVSSFAAEVSEDVRFVGETVPVISGGAIYLDKETKLVDEDDLLTVELLALLIAEIRGETGKAAKFDSDLGYSDISPSDWFASYVWYAHDLGLLTGKNDGTYGVGELADVKLLCAHILSEYEYRYESYETIVEDMEKYGIEVKCNGDQITFGEAINVIRNSEKILGGMSYEDFRKSKPLTREELMVHVAALHSVQEEAESFGIPADFSDVDEDDWFAPFVWYAFYQGWTAGLGDGRFGVGESVDIRMLSTFILSSKGYEIADYHKTPEQLEGLGVKLEIDNPAELTVGEALELIKLSESIEAYEGNDDGGSDGDSSGGGGSAGSGSSSSTTQPKPTIELPVVENSEPLTKEWLMILIADLNGLLSEAQTFGIPAYFNDVNSDDWFAPYVRYAFYQGWTVADDDNNFGVGRHVSVKELCRRILISKNYPVKDEDLVVEQLEDLGIQFSVENPDRVTHGEAKDAMDLAEDLTNYWDIDDHQETKYIVMTDFDYVLPNKAGKVAIKTSGGSGLRTSMDLTTRTSNKYNETVEIFFDENDDYIRQASEAGVKIRLKMDDHKAMSGYTINLVEESHIVGEIEDLVLPEVELYFYHYDVTDVAQVNVKYVYMNEAVRVYTPMIGTNILEVSFEKEGTKHTIVKEVDLKAGKNIIKLTEGYSPSERTLTKATLMVLLSEIYNIKKEASTFGIPADFSDVDENDWYAPYVWYSFYQGWNVGNGDGTFGPREAVSTDYAIAQILRDLDCKGIGESQYADYLELIGVEIDSIVKDRNAMTDTEFVRLRDQIRGAYKDLTAVVSVSIDNHPNVEYRTGFNMAEQVFEMPVAPGITRFLAVYDFAGDYYTERDEWPSIGPVRSARSAQIDIVSAIGGSYVHAGGSADALAEVTSAPVNNIDEIYGRGVSFWRHNRYDPPHNLYIHAAALEENFGNIDFEDYPSTKLFKTGDMEDGAKNKVVDVNFGEGFTPVSYKWNEDDERYVRYQDGKVFDNDDDVNVQVDNIVVIYTDFDEEYIKKLNETVLNADLIDSGVAEFYRDGKMWRGTWEKKSATSDFDFEVNGEDMKFAYGNMWIAVVDKAEMKDSLLEDTNLEAAVRDALSYPSNHIKVSELEEITELTVIGRGIENLDGIELMTSLQKLDLTENEISDISLLKNMTSLTDLNIRDNNIVSVEALSGLTNLKDLCLAGNKISDITPLENLVNLEHLYIYWNQVTNIDVVKNLVNLKSLGLLGNEISDLSPVKDLVNLESLELHNTKVTDINVLKNLTKLRFLNLSNAGVSDISILGTMPELSTLFMSGNNVSDIRPLKNLKNLQVLSLASNNIKDISTLSSLTKLRELQLQYNKISNIQPLRGLSNLTELNLENNPVIGRSTKNAVHKKHLDFTVADKTYEIWVIVPVKPEEEEEEEEKPKKKSSGGGGGGGGGGSSSSAPTVTVPDEDVPKAPVKLDKEARVEMLKEADAVAEAFKTQTPKKAKENVKELTGSMAYQLENEEIDGLEAVVIAEKMTSVVSELLSLDDISAEDSKELVEDVIESNINKAMNAMDSELDKKTLKKEISELVQQTMNKAGKVAKASKVESTDAKTSVTVAGQDIANAVKDVSEMQSDLVKKLNESDLGDIQTQIVKKVVLGIPELEEEKDQLEVAIDTDALETLNEKTLAVQVNVNEVSFVLPSKLLKSIGEGRGVQVVNKAVEKSVEASITKDAVSEKGLSLKSLGKVYDLDIMTKESNANTADKMTVFEEKPVIELSVTNFNLSGVNEGKLGVYVYDESSKTWEHVQSERMGESFVFEAPHFSMYTLMETNVSFTDVDGHWAKDAIEKLAADHIVSGRSDGSFDPNGTVTRAEFASMLVNLLDLNDDISANYSDVKEDAWYYNAVGQAGLNGLSAGTEKGNFRPDENITREEMATMLIQAYKVKTGTKLTGGNAQFSDLTQASDYAKEAICAAKTYGIISGYNDGSFKPNNEASRAEAVAMIMKMLEI